MPGRDDGGRPRGPFRIGVLVSGEGTNLQAILDQLHGPGEVEVVGVVSSRRGAVALGRAARAGVETAVFEVKEFVGREERDLAMAEWLSERGVEMVVLAGFMQIVTPAFLDRFRGRVVNVHPALLPSFPGLNAIERQLQHGVRVGGVTVHLVDEGVDSGPILLQEALDVPYTRDLAEFEARIHAVEHRLLPKAIRLLAAGAVSIDEDNPRVMHVDESQFESNLLT